MKKSHGISLAGGLCIALAALALLPRETLHRPSVPDGVTSQRALAESADRQSANLGLRSHVASPPPSSESAAPSKDLQQALVRSFDWRAFTLNAMTRPAEGGYFYAAHALGICGRNIQAVRQLAEKNAVTEIAETGTLDPRVVAIRARLFADCAAFVDGETAQLSRTLKAKIDTENSDPLTVAEREAIAAIRKASKSEVEAAARKLLALDDPLLLSARNLLYGIATADAEAREKTGLVFNGKLITVAEEPEYTKALYALQLGACRNDAPCAADDEIRFACAAGRYCPASREADVRHRLSLIGAKTSDAEQVFEMAASVRRAVQERDIAFFVRP